MMQLSVKESEVFSYIIEGFSNGEIATRMGIAEKTVKFHTTSIFKKANVNSRYKIIAEYYKNKLNQVLITNQVLNITKGSN